MTSVFRAWNSRSQYHCESVIPDSDLLVSALHNHTLFDNISSIDYIAQDCETQVM